MPAPAVNNNMRLTHEASTPVRQAYPSEARPPRARALGQPRLTVRRGFREPRVVLA